jgi:hypothetical protein
MGRHAKAQKGKRKRTEMVPTFTSQLDLFASIKSELRPDQLCRGWN